MIDVADETGFYGDGQLDICDDAYRKSVTL